MSIDDFYKVIGYVGLYKWLGKTVDEIPADEITITMVRHRYPGKMIKDLKANGAAIIDVLPGIYRVEGLFYIPTHIIITSKLSGDHPILKILSKSVKRDELSDFISSVSRLTSKGEKELINSVLEVSTRANKSRFEKYKEEKDML